MHTTASVERVSHLSVQGYIARAAPVPEGWPSGLRRTLGKRVYGKPYRGFESHSLRHIRSKSLAFPGFAFSYQHSYPRGLKSGVGSGGACFPERPRHYWITVQAVALCVG